MKRAHGFTLIELMIGVALGLLATIVIAQVFLGYERSKRATTSGSDAQVAGAAALLSLQRDIQASGYGLSAWPSAMGCALSAQYNGAAILNPATDVLAPVVIGFGATSADSDTITIMASGKVGYSVPSTLSATHTQVDNVFTVWSSQGVSVGDLVLAAHPTNSLATGCALAMTTAVTSTTVSHTAAGSAAWNASTAIFPTLGYASNSVLLNLGPNPVRRRYSVNTSSWSLQVQELLTSAGTGTAQEMFPQVVLVKALYGKASALASTGPVTMYSARTPTTNAEWRLVRSVRLVVVARSGQYDKEEVTPEGQLVWDIGALALEDVTGTSTCQTTNQCLPLNVSASGASNAWKHYRYKVFDTVIPLRNMVWNP